MFGLLLNKNSINVFKNYLYKHLLFSIYLKEDIKNILNIYYYRTINLIQYYNINKNI
jgi:hypothetical protein